MSPLPPTSPPWAFPHPDFPSVHPCAPSPHLQAVQMAKAGLKAIYLSGWQVAAENNTAGATYPDQSLYPVNSVPVLVKRINNVSEAVGWAGRCRQAGGRAARSLQRAARQCSPSPSLAPSPACRPVPRACPPPRCCCCCCCYPDAACRPCSAPTRLSAPRARSPATTSCPSSPTQVWGPACLLGQTSWPSAVLLERPCSVSAFAL